MPDWNTNNGIWQTAASWTGGVPNAVGAVANFNSTSAATTTSIVSINSGAAQTVGTMNFSSTGANGFLVRGLLSNTAAATLRFEGAGGAAAQINAENTGVALAGIQGAGNISFVLVSDLIVTTIGASTRFIIDGGLTGSGELAKNGLGTLVLRHTGTASTFTGGLRINGGTVQLEDDDSGLGGGVVTLRNGATLRSSSGSPSDLNRIINNAIETGTSQGTAGSGVITAATGFSVNLTGALALRSSSGILQLGDASDTGTVILSGSSTVASGASFRIGGGTVRFGTAAAAQQVLSFTGSGQVLLEAGATLDTAGLAAQVTSLDSNGGNIVSSSGALNLTINMQGRATVNQAGTITGTAGADRIVLNSLILDIGGGTQFGVVEDLSGWNFLNWNSAVDTVTINGHSRDEILTGTSQNDVINGNGGDDRLTGAGGIDVLIGGVGNDTYVIDTLTDTLVELANEGTDTIELAANSGIASFTLAANFENLTFLSTASGLVGVGNAADNVLTIAGPRAVLAGLDGNDRLVVTDASVNGAELIGGLGNDTYVVATRASTTFELAGEGTDTVETTSAIYALQNNIENLTFTNAIAHAGVGNTLDNLITGSTASDELYGREGNDTLDGGSGAANALFGQEGDDRYFIRVAGDSVIEFANQGRDQVTLTSTVASFTLPANVEDATSIGGAKVIVGNALDNRLSGNNGDDQLVGMDGNDTIIGFGGSDLLQGGSGADQFQYFGGETGFDRILDFVSGTDKIALLSSFFTPTGNVAFVSGAGAVANSANSTFLFDTATGIVSYDDDGNGAGAAVQLCQLNLGQSVVASDFIFI